MKKDYIFIFSIGPVQSFIAQARKTQDLYVGSSLLSDLINYALGYIKCNQGDIIFPYYDEDSFVPKIDENNQHSYPNRIVFKLNIEENEVKTFGVTLEGLIRLKLENLAEEKFDFILTSQYKSLGFGEQIKDFLEVYWVAVKYNDLNYQESYNKLIQSMGMLKSIRPIKQFQETGRKCSLSGEYNVKIYRKSVDEKYKSDSIIRDFKLFSSDNFIVNDNNKEGDVKLETKIKISQLQLGEGLSAISFLKRLYKENDSFPSTARIALFDLVSKINLKSIKDCFEEGHFDEQVLFDENLTQESLDKNGIKRKCSFDVIINKHNEIFKQAKSQNIKTSKYYAILAFDGDDMGKWIGQAKSIEQQKKLSKLLTDFAKKIKIYINNRGKTIYAGGDDFLALVNLNHLTSTIKYINNIFQEDVANAWQYNDNKRLSISMAITIAHYKSPLQKVVLHNRNLLNETKNYFRKKLNSFNTTKGGIGISLMSPNAILGTTFINRNEDLTTFEELMDVFSKNYLSTSLLFKYEESVKNIIGTNQNFDEYQTQLGILQTEFKRILLRSSKPEVKQMLLEKLIEKDRQSIGVSSFLNYQGVELASNNWTINTNNFFAFIKVATKIAQELN